jgi:hypothetical protein
VDFAGEPCLFRCFEQFCVMGQNWPVIGVVNQTQGIHFYLHALSAITAY